MISGNFHKHFDLFKLLKKITLAVYLLYDAGDFTNILETKLDQSYIGQDIKPTKLSAVESGLRQPCSLTVKH